MENAELYTFTVPCDPSAEGCSKHEDGALITTSPALSVWLVATRRLAFSGIEPSRFEEGATDYVFDDPTKIGEDLASEFYDGDPAVGARSMFNALLGGDTYSAAAKKAGVTPACVQRWLKEEWFVAMWRGAKRRLLERCIDMLASASSDAVRVLQGVINDALAPRAARVSASAKVLDVLLRGLETLQLDERLARLEQAAGQRDGEDGY